MQLGISLSDLGNGLNPGFDLPRNFAKVAMLLANNRQGFELEMERMDDLSSIPTGINRPLFLGVHQPTNNIDVLSSDSEHRRRSIDLIKQSLDNAGRLGADYFTVHLQTIDQSWGDETGREKQAQESLLALNEIVNHHKQSHYKFPILIENLEYPKYPSTKEEIIRIADVLSDIKSAPTGLVIDVGHLWHTRSHVSQAHGRRPGGDQIYDTYLDDTLDTVRGQVKVIHFSGSSGHKTHLLPDFSGLSNHAPAFHEAKTPQKSFYDSYNEYNFRRIGAVITKFALSHSEPIPLLNEAIGFPYYFVIANNNQFREMFGRRK